MMATAQELINSAASLAGIKSIGQALDNGVNTQALDRLNRMLDRWRNEGIDLGLSTLAASDTLYIDSADEEAVEMNLAVRLMILFRRPPDPVLFAEAEGSKVELQAKYETVKEMEIPLAIQAVGSRNFNITSG
jgi:hypothetical protein